MNGETGEGLARGARVRGPEDIGDALVREIAGTAVMVGMALDRDGCIAAYCCEPCSPCSDGRVRPGSFMWARTSGVIVAHAHQGTSTAPRGGDLAVTRRLMAAGRAKGVDLVDHIIVAGRSWRSLRESTHLWVPLHL